MQAALRRMKKTWGGAFDKSPDKLAWRFGQSIETDAVLWREELDVSIAHARMLGATGIVPEADALVSELEKIRAEMEIGSLELPPDAEDIHGAIESILFERIGDVAGKLHTGRSRNDQIATVSRLWLRRKCEELRSDIKRLQTVVLHLAEKHQHDPMPGYTHMQRAQPITFGFHLLAHFWMLQRDVLRLDFVEKGCEECPLGSAALAGTPFPVDREMTANDLGFARPSQNALDATSDRDFIGDALHACAMIMQHLSRLSQEITMWSSAEYGFMRLDDAFSTGSSIMPQKRNPDFAELIRGRTGRVYGHWIAFQTMMKALPLGYNRDQQEDKPPLFDAVSLCLDSLALCAGMIETATFDTDRMKATAGQSFSTATAVADALAASGMPFRTAHELAGKLVRECEKRGWSLMDLNEARFSEIGLGIPDSVLQVVDAAGSIRSRDVVGGPGTEAMKRQLEEARGLLDE